MSSHLSSNVPRRSSSAFSVLQALSGQIDHGYSIDTRREEDEAQLREAALARAVQAQTSSTIPDADTNHHVSLEVTAEAADVKSRKQVILQQLLEKEQQGVNLFQEYADRLQRYEGVDQ